MTTTARSPLSRGDGAALGVIATGSITVAIAALVAIVLGAFDAFASRLSVHLPMHGQSTTLFDQVDGVDGATLTGADLVLADPPALARWLLLAEGALPALATIGVGIVAFLLALALMRARPFRRRMPVAIATIACLVIAGGIGGQVAGAFGRAEIVRDLSASSPDITETLWPFLMEIDLAPLGWGLVLALIAGAFSIGQRLQRDTEGLV
ncbi:hypothetical protein [Microbacterium sp. gxy059]|uniref:hypothetical protein n=1 Tax=Microbacterium sp. gxy059 TaxID=2957199 RepID=UPI003D9711AA